MPSQLYVPDIREPESHGNGRGDARKVSRISYIQDVAAPFVFDTFRKVVAEFIGTLFLVFVITFSAQSSPQPISAALLSGLAVAAIVASLAHISGAHVNPAITIGLWFGGEIRLVLVVLYVGAQIAGGVLGALCMRGSLNLETYMNVTGGCNIVDYTYTTDGHAFISEFVQAFMLMMAVMGTAVDKRSTNKMLAPLAIGFVVANGIGIAGKSSSGGMNPARSFGASAVYSMFWESANKTDCASCHNHADVWQAHWIFWAAPISACILCALLFKVILGDIREWGWYTSGKWAARKLSRPADTSDRVDHL